MKSVSDSFFRQVIGLKREEKEKWFKQEIRIN